MPVVMMISLFFKYANGPRLERRSLICRSSLINFFYYREGDYRERIVKEQFEPLVMLLLSSYRFLPVISYSAHSTAFTGYKIRASFFSFLS